MNHFKRENGFTLIEVLAVIIIIAALAAIAIPKLVSSTANARQKADIATAHQVKAALDRYQVENGLYPKSTEFTATGGTVTSTKLIPKYISKLDKTVTQQVAEGKEGFGVKALQDNADKTLLVIPDDTTTPPSNLIMVYLSDKGLGAEVRAYDATLTEILWTSSD